MEIWSYMAYFKNLLAYLEWNQGESSTTESSGMIATLLLEEVLTDTTTPAQQLSPTVDDGIHQIITLSNYSNLTKLIRVTAHVLRFIHNCRHSSNQVGALTSEEQKKR